VTIAATNMAITASLPSGEASPVGSASASSTPRGYRLGSARTLVWMRTTAFRTMMNEEFGDARAGSIARDHVFADLGGRTVDEALASGMAPKQIWRAVCDAFDVPAERR
jgi:hypothetical protein